MLLVENVIKKIEQCIQQLSKDGDCQSLLLRKKPSVNDGVM